MTLDFTRKPGHDGNEPERPRRPNLMSRGFRLKIFGVLATLMLVSLVISRLQDPQFLILTGLRAPGIAGGPPLTKGEVADRRVNTEMQMPSDRDVADTLVLGAADNSARKGPLVGAESDAAESDAANANREQPETGFFATPLGRAWLDGWTAFITKLDQHERSLFYQGIKLSRHHKSLTTDDQKAWELILENANSEWQQYRDAAAKSLQDLPESERASWTKVVQQLQEGWQVELKPALDRIGHGLDVEGADAKTLEELQTVLDRIALSMIEDNTLQRAQETEAWFRFIEKLQALSPEELRKQSSGPVGFLQLFDQPKLYRGHVVTIRGTAKAIERILAPKNVDGVTEYYRYSIHPAGGPDSPFIVYALEVPEGFPTLNDKIKDKTKDWKLAIHEDVEFTGYFFKNWVYAGKSGILRAPMLLAKAPRWQPSPADLRKPPDAATMLAVVLACAIGAVAFAVYVYYQSLKAVSPGMSFKEGFSRGQNQP